jgi:Putative esterase
VIHNQSFTPETIDPMRVFLILLATACPTFAGFRIKANQGPCAIEARRTVSPMFQVRTAHGLTVGPVSGRLFIVLGPPDGREPRLGAGNPGARALPIFGMDVTDLEPGARVTITESAAGFPMASLRDVAEGEYSAQAVLELNRDLKGLSMPGNLYSKPQRVRISEDSIFSLELTERIPDEQVPPDTDVIKYLKVKSEVLSAFHGRPVYLRAAVILPPDFDRQPDRKFPLRVHIGGFGDRYTSARFMMSPGSEFRRASLAEGAPRFLTLCLDGAGPLGDPYQVDSANHGPYGTAITTELIPLVEQTFRGRGTPQSRVLDGGSTGGWVALALQVFYPDLFNGAWGFCPDSVDFRSFQLVNIYEDANAYEQADGSDRPAFREDGGRVGYSMRHECTMENVLGAGDSWTMSGGQWGSWNAVYGPRGSDGRPVPLWDPKTGKIDHAVAEQWKKYDLRRILEENWSRLGPKLRGKLHVRVGEADNYFLEGAVHRLDAFLSKAQPPFEGSIEYGPGEGHCWSGISESELLRQMAQRVGD